MSSITTDNDGNNNLENLNYKYVNIINGKYCEEAKIATLAALEAGHFALEGQKQAKANVSVNNNNDSLGVLSKGGIDLVTKYDKGCEKLIFDRLREHFASYEFIGEESSSENKLTDSPTFCVDPIDGTTNFVHALPMFAISIGLLVNKRSVLGIIYIPSSGLLYQAAEKCGAYLNAVRIHVDDADNLSSALIATNFGHSRDPTIVKDQITSVHNLLKKQARSIRMLGSCCVSMAYVASGECSAYYESNIGGIWDIAAGCVIVQEAGGVICNLNGDIYDVLNCGTQKILCGNTAVCNVIAEHLS